MNTEVKTNQPQAIGTKAHLLAIMERAKAYADEHHERTHEGKPNVVWQLEVNAFAEGAIAERSFFPGELRKKITEALVAFVQKGTVPWAKEVHDENLRLLAENAKLREAALLAKRYIEHEGTADEVDQFNAALAGGSGGGQ